jgi:hypothetical protein
MRRAKPAPAAAEWPRDAELAVRRFRLRAQRRAAWLEAMWAEPRAAAAALAVIFDDRDSPANEQAWAGEHSKEIAQVEAALEKLEDSRWARLRTILALTPADEDLLQACFAVAIDPALGRVCAVLNESPARPYVTEPMAARLFGHGRHGVWTAESGVYRWDLVHAREAGPGEPRALACDDRVRDWLLREDTLDAALTGLVALQPILEPIGSWPLDSPVETARAILANERSGRVQMIVSGPPGCGRRSYAAVVAARLGLPLLTVDCDRIDDARWPLVFERVQRHAFLERSALAWVGDSAAKRIWPRRVPWFPVQFLICDPGQQPPALPGFVQRRVTPPPLTASDRERLWRAYVPETAKWPAGSFRAFVERYPATPGDIATASRVPDHSPTAIRRSLQQSSRARLEGLATFLPCPFTWDDLVLDQPTLETLKDIAFEAAHRSVFWEQRAARRLFPQGRGLTALFTGPPGTGKTMSAQVIAAGLHFDLIRVDVAAVVSKYVGEMVQNIDRIFARARYSNAILFFDEADAMFARRSDEVRDAQDKFANTDAAYLLMAIESYPGVTLLSTNQKGNIDPAFFRRLRFIVEYAKPAAPQRLIIWRRIVGELMGEPARDGLERVLLELANSVEMTGAQIKSAVLGAIFIAKRAKEAVGARHLTASLQRELVKHGRPLGTREWERLAKHG